MRAVGTSSSDTTCPLLLRVTNVAVDGASFSSSVTACSQHTMSKLLDKFLTMGAGTRTLQITSLHTVGVDAQQNGYQNCWACSRSDSKREQALQPSMLMKLKRSRQEGSKRTDL